MNDLLRKGYKDYLLFGLILFSDAHPEVIRMLQDPLYYRAVDELSGEHLGIFVTTVLPQVSQTSPSHSGVYDKLIPIKKEPQANLEILGWFGIETRDQLPAFVVFGFENLKIHYTRFQIDQSASDRAYESLRSGINATVREIERVKKKTGPISFDRERLISRLNRKAKVIWMRKGMSTLLDMTAKIRAALPF